MDPKQQKEYVLFLGGPFHMTCKEVYSNRSSIELYVVVSASIAVMTTKRYTRKHVQYLKGPMVSYMIWEEGMTASQMVDCETVTTMSPSELAQMTEPIKDGS
jgi:hypothetical protein